MRSLKFLLQVLLFILQGSFYKKIIMSVPKVVIGLDMDFNADLENAIHKSSSEGYDFACMDVVKDKQKFSTANHVDYFGGKTDSKFMLNSQDWSNFVVGKLSTMELNQLNDREVADVNINMIDEINFCSYFGLPAVLVKVTKENCSNVAQVINCNLLNSIHVMNVWVQIQAPENDDYYKEAWKLWNKFRCLCDHSSRLKVVLPINKNLPDIPELKQWLGEPVQCLFIETSTFITNKKGYPVLSRAHQSVVQQFFAIKSQVVVSGKSLHDSQMRSYNQYISHLFNVRPHPDQYQVFSDGYEDYLQSPLQPLMDNLESATYEVFEKDPVKYKLYRLAVQACLEERHTNADKPVIVMVVGAGRGPLVRAAFQAADDAGVKIKCFAVEKNVNAVVTLKMLKRTEWVNKDVTIISSDMRHWKPSELADIMVSELLGSFSDNELSPECLDGAQKLMKPNGVSIPQSYTSYLAPVSSQKLYNEVRNCSDHETKKPKLTAFEMPYVVRIHNFCSLDEPKKVFTFEHPSKQDESNNPHLKNFRFKELKFEISRETVLHGFAGYFECQLYNQVLMSILPKTHSPGMFSWFPIFFPMAKPLHLRKGDDLEVSMWRKCTSSKVWYEWCVSEPQCTNIHNPGGRSYTIGL